MPDVATITPTAPVLAGVVVVLVLALLACVAYVVVLTRQLRSISAQLARRIDGRSHAVVSIDLVHQDLNTMVARINETIRDAELAASRIRESDEQFRSLMADISHDLRTPLAAIRGYQQLLASTDLDPEQRARLEVAQRYTIDLIGLVDRLFEYAYLLSNPDDVDPEPVDVSELVTETLVASTDVLEEIGLDVRFDPGGRAILRSDRGKVTRIVQNLVRNTLQHARDWVAVAITRIDDGMRVEFANPVAPGSVDPERLFERFYTGDPSRASRTTGLGLSIIALLAAQLRGTAGAFVAGDVLHVVVELPDLPEEASQPAPQSDPLPR